MKLLKKIANVRSHALLNKDGSIKDRDGNPLYAIRTENGILSHFRPLLDEAGLILWVENVDCLFASPTSIKVKVICVIADIETGEQIRFAGIGSGIDKGDKDSGKALTYAYRNAIQKLFMLISGEDSENTSSDQTLEALKNEAHVLTKSLWDKKAFHAPLKDGSPCDAETASARYSSRVDAIESCITLQQLEDLIGPMRQKEQELNTGQ